MRFAAKVDRVCEALDARLESLVAAFAKFDPAASWLDDLQPAFGEREWWFQPSIRAMQQQGWQPSWGDRSRVRKRVTTFGHVEWE